MLQSSPHRLGRLWFGILLLAAGGCTTLPLDGPEVPRQGYSPLWGLQVTSVSPAGTQHLTAKAAIVPVALTVNADGR